MNSHTLVVVYWKSGKTYRKSNSIVTRNPVILSRCARPTNAVCCHDFFPNASETGPSGLRENLMLRVPRKADGLVSGHFHAATGVEDELVVGLVVLGHGYSGLWFGVQERRPSRVGKALQACKTPEARIGRRAHTGPRQLLRP